jgi:uncharacterized membrane protein YqgA involved in biofilm formation
LSETGRYQQTLMQIASSISRFAIQALIKVSAATQCLIILGAGIDIFDLSYLVLSNSNPTSVLIKINFTFKLDKRYTQKEKETWDCCGV